MSKEAIDHVKKVAEQVNEWWKSLADLMSKTCLWLEETLRYRFPISSELKAYYEWIEKGINIPTLITKIKNDNNLWSGASSNLNGTLTEQLNYYNIQITQKQTNLQNAQQSYDTYSYSGSWKNDSSTLANAVNQAQNSLNNSVSLRDRVKTEIDKVKAIIAPLQDFDTNWNLSGIATSRKSEITGIKNTFNKFSINSTVWFPHNTIDQNNANVNTVDLWSHIFSSPVWVGQSYLFYDEQSQQETKSLNKDGTVSTSVLLKDGSYREVKIKWLYIDTTTQKVVFDKIQVEWVDDADYPIQIRSLNVRGILQEGGREYYMDKQLSLTINQWVGTVNKSAILDTDPAVTNLFAQRFPLYIGQHITHPHRPNSEFKKVFDDSLSLHPDFAKLADSHKNMIFDRLTTINSTTRVPGDEYPLMSLESIMRTTTIMNPKFDSTKAIDPITNPETIDDPYIAFKSYVVDNKKVEPKPTPNDLKDATSYSNWVARNMSLLISNFVKHHINSCLARTDVAQNVNEYISRYTTTYEQKELTSTVDAATSARTAARKLITQRPRWAAADGINKRTGKNDSRLRLMGGKSATMSDTVKTDDGTEKSYTTTLNTWTKGKMFANLTLPNGKILTLAGPTPGDLLSKILTSARIDESQWGQRMRLMMAFWTLKALVKLTRDAGAPMTIPINGTRDELRIDLADDDTISVARYDYNSANDEFVKSPRLDFDEKNPDHKMMMTNNFITDLNGSLNTILDNHYSQFKTTMSDGTNIFKRFWRFMMFERGRMTYEADSNVFGVRSLRWWMKKAMNRKETPVEWFSFPIQSGNKQGSVSYDPKWYITVEIDGKIRKDKNLAKLVNPWAMRNVFGIFQRKQNMTDWFEMQIMNGIYSQLSWQLMQNSRVNKYTYLVRDKNNGVMYACYAGEDGTPRMGIIEHTNQNDMLMMDRQRWWRHVGIPEQGLRELNEEETQSVLSRPYIMDTVLQNMLKAREEIFRIPLTGYRSMWLSANVASQLAIAGAVWGIDMLAGGWLSTHASSAAYAVGNFTTGTLLPWAEKVVTTTGKALWNALDAGYGVARKVWWWLRDGAKAAA